MDERWKPVSGFEDRYEVSSHGRCRRLDGRILKPIVGNRGYPGYSLWRDGRARQLRASRMVAVAFLPNPDDLPIVMHLDDNPMNNVVENLRWGTQRDNVMDMVSKGRHGGQGDRCRRGHEYTAENTGWVKRRGVRFCKTCQAASNARSLARRK